MNYKLEQYYIRFHQVRQHFLVCVFLIFLFTLSLPLTYASSSITRSDKIPDFSSMSVKDRKKVFINTLLPLIYTENRRIEAQRTKLQGLSDQTSLTIKQKHWIESIAVIYALPVKKWPPSSDWFIQILRRVDSLPPSLVLVQAANESGWGTSRFAREGNNYFGMWCYTPGCGLVPKKRSPGKIHEVQVFPSIQASVSAYYNNINSHAAYTELRSIRATERQEGLPLDSLKLIQGLSRYSQRGQAYVKSLSLWIQRDKLKKYDLYHRGNTEYYPYYQQEADLYSFSK